MKEFCQVSEVMTVEVKIPTVLRKHTNNEAVLQAERRHDP